MNNIIKLTSLLAECQEILNDLISETDNSTHVSKGQLLVGFSEKRSFGGTGITMGIDADTVCPEHKDYHSYGTSFKITFKDDQSITVDGEVGYSSYNLGFDSFFDIERNYNSFDEMMDDLKRLVESLAFEYKMHLRSPSFGEMVK